ncbi:hypothetical protein J2S43_006942 [Catenuloplanes nepalensis]|uniref:Concanavalin A-like lectin/glucanase superfamily protein n=1 Tax=Catenuloplanes nepalensis TaxID=587533 RepID=A0ABT9N3Z7_9ACTN|nr:LamG domain-containing protein [Catenuloplanes nepalensis]MDP9798430.1 hypothetical protein [Catenuloplanes nepalensis]
MIALLAGVVAVTGGPSAPPVSAPSASPSPLSSPSTFSSSLEPFVDDGGIEVVPPADEPIPTEVARVAPGPVTVRYTFDGGAGRQFLDVTGRYGMRTRTAVGGALRLARHGGGWAAAFPSRCTALPQNCPRAILEGGDPVTLNPGLRRLRYGASVMMRPTDTADGANVVQKGFSVGGGTQYKLQVDGLAGRPSCVVASPARIYRVVAPVRVADGRWHAVACVRAGGALSINVDGVARGSTRLPARLSIANPEPLRIGGKSVTANNDQYAGQVDDVYVTIN